MTKLILDPNVSDLLELRGRRRAWCRMAVLLRCQTGGAEEQKMAIALVGGKMCTPKRILDPGVLVIEGEHIFDKPHNIR